MQKPNGKEVKPEVEPLNEVQMRQVLEPDAVTTPVETFIFGKNGDNTPRTWKLIPLDWTFEKMFRHHAMPLLAESYKPFETVVQIMAQPFITDKSPSVVSALIQAELAADDYLTNALHIILLSQDSSIKIDWVEKSAKSRDQMFDIIEKQANLHRLMDRLGERLAERLQRLAQMMGVPIDLVTLKRLWKQHTADFSAKISGLATTADNAFGRFTENLSEPGASPSTSQSNSPNLAEELMSPKGSVKVPGDPTEF